MGHHLTFLSVELCKILFVFYLICNDISLSFSSTYSAKMFTSNVTTLLDSLLANYDMRIRPGHGGPPTIIVVNMNVRSMGPFSETEESYAMQLYLRHVWFDSRLQFDRDSWGRPEFSMNWMFAERIWKPDTFFINGKNSYQHQITAPNMFIRLRHDGQLMWSMRLTVRGTCMMHLRKFPLDTQICPLKMASYGYNSKDVIYQWDQAKLVTVASDVSLAQYELADITTSAEMVTTRQTETISTLTVRFQLHRLTGFFMLQVYVPCILIVFSSWVAFWISKKDTPGRVGLGVTTVLSLTQLGFGTGPPVSYATAVDYFVVLCFMFVFAAILEYAFINFTERAASKRAKKMEKFRLRIREKIETAAREGRSLIPVVGKPVYKDSLHQLLKLALTLVPPASELALINPDEPDPGDMRGAFKNVLKVAFVAMPGTSDMITDSERRSSLDSFDEVSKPGLLKSSLLSVPKLVDHGKKELPPPPGPTEPHKEKEAKPPVNYTPQRRRSRAPSIIVELFPEEEPPPSRHVKIWELVLQKSKLISIMKPFFTIPQEEEILERFHVVDFYARRIFPTFFLLVITLYWYLYNYYITDEFPGVKIRPKDGLVVTSSL